MKMLAEDIEAGHGTLAHPPVRSGRACPSRQHGDDAGQGDLPRTS